MINNVKYFDRIKKKVIFTEIQSLKTQILVKYNFYYENFLRASTYPL